MINTGASSCPGQ